MSNIKKHHHTFLMSKTFQETGFTAMDEAIDIIHNARKYASINKYSKQKGIYIEASFEVALAVHKNTMYVGGRELLYFCKVINNIPTYFLHTTFRAEDGCVYIIETKLPAHNYALAQAVAIISNALPFCEEIKGEVSADITTSQAVMNYIIKAIKTSKEETGCAQHIAILFETLGMNHINKFGFVHIKTQQYKNEETNNLPF